MVTLLVAILSGVVYGTIAGFTRSESISKEQREMDEIASGIFSKLMFELSTTTAGQLSNGAHSSTTGGSDTTNRSFFGQTGGEEGTNGILHFVCLNGGTLGLPTQSNLGPIEVVYRTAAKENSPGGDDQRLELIREEYPADVAKTSPEALRSRGRRRVLTNKLSDFSISFFNRGQWSNSYILPYPGLPRAVGIQLTLTSDTGRKFSYKTAIITSEVPVQ